MDSRLHYKQHIARAATKGLGAAMELKRLKGMAPSTTRQLFTAMVAPVVDYASNVWMHACKTVSAYAIHRVQRIGAQAIIGSFTSVATGVAEAEAHIATIQERFWRRASKLWVDIHTLPRTNPAHRGYMQRVTEGYHGSHSAIHPRSRQAAPRGMIWSAWEELSESPYPWQEPARSAKP
ncbi:Uncharacterized protein HZ326_31883, partial [Fusarium oxysporum f. sp. albedinis]